MPLIHDALEATKQRLVAKCQRVLAIREERTKLAAAYNRYVDLHNEQRELERGIDRLVGLLGGSELYEAIKRDETEAIGNTIEPYATPASLRDQLALWEAIEEYLLYADEARISEIQGFLSNLDIGASREAIESALRRHPEMFRIRHSGREKFISLKKGVTNALATNKGKKHK